MSKPSVHSPDDAPIFSGGKSDKPISTTTKAYPGSRELGHRPAPSIASPTSPTKDSKKK